MRLSRGRTCGWVAALVLGVCVATSAQDSSPSLGDVARKTRKEHAASGHAAARPLASEEDDGPDSGGVWRVKLCVQQPCHELAVSLPKHPTWTRAPGEPRPVLIPLAGHEDDASHAIRVYAADSLTPGYPVDGGKRTFLQSWFARPEYFGQAAHLVLDEHMMIDDHNAVITHFTVLSGALKYRGLSVVAGTVYGSFGFACVFRDEDTNAATSICDAIVKSVRAQTLQPAIPKVYPTNDPLHDDPPDDPPDSDEPE